MKSGISIIGAVVFLFTFTSTAIFAEETTIDTTPPDTKPIYKANLENSIALGPRIGNFLWQSQVIPSGATSANGIRGNFIFNGPTIPSIGFGTRFGLTKLIRLAPTIDFTFDEYVYRADLGQAFMTQSMTGSAVGPVATVMGILISIPVWFDIYLSDRVVLSLAPGLAFYPRIAIIAIDNSTGIDAISTSLNSDLRWLYPETGISIKYALDTNTSVGFEVQVLYPLSHIGKNDNSGIDGMIITGFFGFDLYL